jgi:hypothetical protein
MAIGRFQSSLALFWRVILHEKKRNLEGEFVGDLTKSFFFSLHSDSRLFLFLFFSVLYTGPSAAPPATEEKDLIIIIIIIILL